jgi:hypothetical protein
MTLEDAKLKAILAVLAVALALLIALLLVAPRRVCTVPTNATTTANEVSK